MHRRFRPSPAFRAQYDAYLASPEWETRRQRVFERDGHRCRICNSPEGLQAHHRTYQRFGREEMDDLTTLCESCHQTFHDIFRSGKSLPAISITQGALPSVELFRMLLNNSPKFAETWYRQRWEFESQEQYNLALCRLAAMAGWAEQDMANLIGCHRGWDDKALSFGYVVATIRKAQTPMAERR